MKLSKHTRFRKETDYILLCRVDTLQYFEVGIKWSEILKQLKNGIKFPRAKTISKEELNLFLKDLNNIGLLEC